MKTATLLIAFCFLSISAFAGSKRDADVRNVTVYPLTKQVTLPEEISHTSVADSVNGLYSQLFSLTVTVSDDPGKIYSIDCFVYRTWNHCDLPAATSYSAEIKGNTVKITAVENNRKHTTYKVKYTITFIQPDATAHP
jgi:hypothetical protein